MIPKIIHFCWFGGNTKPKIVLECIESWKKECPDYILKEWNESNFSIKDFSFTSLMYEAKHWAFVSDYVRLFALETEGGIYLDTDMFLLKSLDPLLDCDLFLGEEEPSIISAGAIGAIKNHEYIKTVRRIYDTEINERITIPKILTKVFNNFENKNNILVLPPITFYPFSPTEIKLYKGQKLANETYGVHLWNYSWGSPINKFFIKIGIYSLFKKIAIKLGVKDAVKKILKIV